MTKEKALIMALKIVDVCKTYGNDERCLQCPFNINGCIATDGNNIPSDWRVSELINAIETQGKK
jgi:hypothetical protein